MVHRKLMALSHADSAIEHATNARNAVCDVVGYSVYMCVVDAALQVVPWGRDTDPVSQAAATQLRRAHVHD
jgi:hypothetical protein